MKTNVAVLFGGKSTEHEVSVISGIQAFCALNTEKYNPLAIYITKNNEWYVGEKIGNIKAYTDLKALLADSTRVLPVPSGDGKVELLCYPFKKFGKSTVAQFEVAIPVVHGTNVEDGTLMGYLEMLGVPYASCDVTSSALGMDKAVMKDVLKRAGVPVLDAYTFMGSDYIADSEAVVAHIESTIGYPVIVKPVNLGSSVGISKADDRDALVRALDTAISYSPRVLAERAVGNLREINCAVLGDSEDAIASVCEEPLNATDILTFEDKYMSGGKSGSKGGAKSAGMADLKRRCPAELPDGMTEQVQALAVQTFQALGCLGVSRIDFLNDKQTGELWVNEINTIPGSLAFYLWEAAGIPFAELLDRMIALAFKRQRQREALTFSFETNLLAGAAAGLATGKK